MRSGGAEGNERLTATAAVLVLLLLAVEGLTILFIRPLLTLHMFIGVVLIPPLCLKLASNGYRFVRYYSGNPVYRAKGPPWLFMRVLAPVLVAATAVVITSGVYLLASGQRAGTWVGVHKASFVVWLAVAATHVLVYVWRLPALALDRRAPGFTLRVALVATVLVVGLWVADETALHDRFT
jgi:cytochrome b subunit of formate dehydrogenase